ncbi:MAG: DUF4194 domain-containing protein [Pontibacterium sp.]
MSYNNNEPEQAPDFFDQLRIRQPGQQAGSDEMLPAENITVSAISDPADSPANKATESTTLTPEGRRALVNLLRQGVVLALKHPAVFEVICRYQPAIRHYLSEIYLKLVLDEKTGVAFIAGLDEGDNDNEETVSLITRRTLSLYDTLLLLVLRKHYQERESTGEQRVIIDIERIEANILPFLPLTNSTKSDRRKLSAALKKMLEKHLLSTVRGSDDRFEITPVIRYVVNAAFMETMLAEYQRLAREAGEVRPDES